MIKGKKGKNGGSYPYHYREMIDDIFGKDENTIEVCSGSVKGRNASPSPNAPFTVDINPDLNPDYVADAQVLKGNCEIGGIIRCLAYCNLNTNPTSKNKILAVLPY